MRIIDNLLMGRTFCFGLVNCPQREEVNSFNILSAIGLNPEDIHKPRAGKTSYTEFLVEPEDDCAGAAAAYAGPGPAGAWSPAPGGPPPPAAHHPPPPPPPTGTSNWVVPGRLLIGEKPGGDPTRTESAELAALLDAGVTTFVCLIGEYRSWQAYRDKAYPKKVSKIQRRRRLQDQSSKAEEKEAEGGGGGRGPRFLYFPVRDFDVPPADDLVELVLELRRRVLAGEVLFVHCRGGHGRTGLAVVPLVAALFGLGAEDARGYVQESHDISPRGMRWGGHLPETQEQMDLVIEIIERVQKNSRRRR